ncbi:MAG: hypothetical protein HYU34_03525 [Candidatus Omnitrophica bacterium]|nr:hypothetical protein [Candidatus Omnitrophota bacterium]
MKRNRRSISILTVCFFLFNLFLPVPGALMAGPASSEILPGLLNGMDPSTAKVEEVSLAPPRAGKAPVFFYVQDAHAHPDAQQSIRGLLHYFNEKFSGRRWVVALEGARGPLHPEYLEFFKDYPGADRKIREDLLQKGELTGAELFAWDLYENGRPRVVMEGVEDPGTYRAHREAYLALTQQIPEAEQILQKLFGESDQLASTVFNPELRKFVKERTQRGSGRYLGRIRPFGSFSTALSQWDVYIRYLTRRAKEALAIDVGNPYEQIRFPNLHRIAKLSQSQKERPSAARLRLKTLEEEIRFPGLQKEIEALERALEAKLVHRKEEKELLSILRDLELLQGLLYLELKPAEWAKIRARRSEFRPADLAERLKRLGAAGEGAVTGKRPPKSVAGPSVFEAALRFYESAGRREPVLIENALDLARSHNAEILVMITGGFHAEGLKESLKSQGVSYASLQPALRKAVPPGQYHRVMQGKNADLFQNAGIRAVSKQVSLLMKEMIEVGLPEIARDRKLSDDELGALLKQAVNDHPLLGKEISEAGPSGGEHSSRLSWQIPAFISGPSQSALLEKMLTQDSPNYARLADSAGSPVNGRARLAVEIRSGRPQVSLLRPALRSELRNTGYRPQGPPLTTEERWNHFNLKAELPFLVKFAEKLKELKAKAGVHDPIAALEEEAFERKGIDIQPPGKGDLEVPFDAWQSMKLSLGAIAPELEPEKHEARKATLEGIEAKMALIDPIALELDKDAGRKLLREKKQRIIILAGGMSVRGAIWADQPVYIPGWGIIPLLALKILTAYHRADQLGLPRPLIAIAESDFTAPKVEQALEWMVQKGYLTLDEKDTQIDRFLVSIVPRLDRDGSYFRPGDSQDEIQTFANASHGDGYRYYVLSGLWGDDQEKGVQVVSFLNMNVPTATFDERIPGRLFRLSQPDEDGTPGKAAMLLEFTDNRGEQGGFLANVIYRLKGRLRFLQSIEGWLLDDRNLGEIKRSQEDFPVFNTNSAHFLHAFIGEMYGLANLKFIPTRQALEADSKQRERLRDQVNSRISLFGDEAPGEKIATYPEEKSIDGEPVVQLARLLSDPFRIAARRGGAIAYYVPRETWKAVPSRYDEAKKIQDIALNGKAFQAALLPQLPPPHSDERPLPEADELYDDVKTIFRKHLEIFDKQQIPRLKAVTETISLLKEAEEDQWNATTELATKPMLQESIGLDEKNIEFYMMRKQVAEEALSALFDLYRYFLADFKVQDPGNIQAWKEKWEGYDSKGSYAEKTAWAKFSMQTDETAGEKRSEVRGESKVRKQRPTAEQIEILKNILHLNRPALAGLPEELRKAVQEAARTDFENVYSVPSIIEALKESGRSDAEAGRLAVSFVMDQLGRQERQAETRPFSPAEQAPLGQMILSIEAYYIKVAVSA